MTTCPAGQYPFHNNNSNETTLSLLQDNMQCQPVGMGYYSPEHDLNCYPCKPGTFSNLKMAEYCISCPSGTFVITNASSHCEDCPPGTYRFINMNNKDNNNDNVSGGSSSGGGDSDGEELSGTMCHECDSYYYHGYGSDFAVLLKFCFCIRKVVGFP